MLSFDNLLTASWQASILIALLVALRWIPTRWLAARWRCALWMIVFVRLILPVRPPSPWTFAALGRPQIASSLFVPGEEHVTVRFGTISHDSAPSPTVYPIERPRFDWRSLLVPTWLSIAGLLVAFRLIGAARLGLTIRRLPTAQSEALAMTVEQALRLFPTRRPRIVETNLVTSPSLAGFFRPTLLLPPALSEQLDRQQLCFILLHELAHARRRDVLVGFIASIITAVHWFNPLIWLAAARFRDDRELACDAAVLSITDPAARPAYGQTILDLLGRFTQPTPAPAVALISSRRTVQHRIAAVARFRKSNRFTTIVAAMIVATVALLTLTTPRHAAFAAAPTSSSTETSKTPASNPATITRIYDIRDTLVEVPDFEADLQLGPHTMAHKPSTHESTHPSPQPQRTRAQLIESTKSFIMDEVDPTSWKERGGSIGSMRQLAGQLVITQTPANHDAILTLLQSLRQTRAVQITVETRFLTGENIFKKLEEISKPNHWLIEKDLQTWPAYLDANQVKVILGACQQSLDSTLITAPRLTLFNGQRAYVVVSRETAYISDLVQGKASDPEPFKAGIDFAKSGVLIDAQARASSDRQFAIVTLRPQLASLIDFTPQRWAKSPPDRNDLVIQVPHMAIVRAEMTTSIPNDRTAVFRVRQHYEPPSTTQPVCEPVMILIHPIIVEQREIDPKIIPRLDMPATTSPAPTSPTHATPWPTTKPAA